MCVNSEGSGQTAQMRRLAWAFAGRLCDKYYKFDEQAQIIYCNHMNVLNVQHFKIMNLICYCFIVHDHE